MNANTDIYLCKPPFIPDMGSISPFNVRESLYLSKEEDTLLEINKMRERDGLESLKELPEGVEFFKAE